MSTSLTIYNAASIEIEAVSGSERPGYFELIATEIDGTEVEITVHFDTAQGFAFAKQLAHIARAINAKEPA